MPLNAPVQQPKWHAGWIWHPDVALSSPAYVLFRNRFDLTQPIEDIVLRVSADERYVLYLDGKPISRGPSRTDQLRWGYRTVHTGLLAAGPHVLAAIARHLGALAEIAQIGLAGGFLLSAEPPFDDILDTGTKNTGWCCKLDPSRLAGPQYYGSAFFSPLRTETIDGRLATWDFAALECDPAGWVEPRPLNQAETFCVLDPSTPWWLVPDPLPEMEYRHERFERVARIDGGEPAAWQGLITQDKPLTIAAHTAVTVVLDRGHLTNAYPALVVSGGSSADILATWSEAPVEPVTGKKGNRNEVTGRKIVGHQDRFIPDGGEHRTFETYWFRPFRYAEVTIQTAGQPLTIERFDLFFTGYPFEQNATFEPAGPDLGLERIRELGWRTLRLCAHETFYDCPHYEQLQYVGDTRIMAVLIYLESGDDRLARKAIDDFYSSRLPDGLTSSRWPCRLRQVIPPFSLYWIGMLHDFWRYRGDLAFLQGYLPTVRGILDWFRTRRGDDGLLGPMPYWCFCDWTTGWAHGVPPGTSEGGSTLLSLLLAQALGWSADLHAVAGMDTHVQQMRNLRGAIEQAVQADCWDASKQAYADTPERKTFSVHVQIQSVLNGLEEGKAARDLLLRSVPDLGGKAGFTPLGTPYWYYYLFLAMRQTDLADRVLELMGPWQRMLDDGMTTCTEVFGESRSDCHAWGDSPNIVFLTTVLGIQPAEPGFRAARIEPHLGPLTAVKGSIPTPHGPIRVEVAPPIARVQLPEGVKGVFVWKGRETPLRPGLTEIRGNMDGP